MKRCGLILVLAGVFCLAACDSSNSSSNAPDSTSEIDKVPSLPVDHLPFELPTPPPQGTAGNDTPPRPFPPPAGDPTTVINMADWYEYEQQEKQPLYSAIDDLTYEASLNNPDSLFCFEPSKWKQIPLDRQITVFIHPPGTHEGQMRQSIRKGGFTERTSIKRMLSVYTLPGDQSKWAGIEASYPKNYDFLSFDNLRAVMEKLGVSADQVGTILVATPMQSILSRNDAHAYVKFSDKSGHQLAAAWYESPTELNPGWSSEFRPCLSAMSPDAHPKAAPDGLYSGLYAKVLPSVIADSQSHLESFLKQRFGPLASADNIYYISAQDNVYPQYSKPPHAWDIFSYVDPLTKVIQRIACDFEFDNSSGVALFKSMNCVDMPLSQMPVGVGIREGISPSEKQFFETYQEDVSLFEIKNLEGLLAEALGRSKNNFPYNQLKLSNRVREEKAGLLTISYDFYKSAGEKDSWGNITDPESSGHCVTTFTRTVTWRIQSLTCRLN